LFLADGEAALVVQSPVLEVVVTVPAAIQTRKQIVSEPREAAAAPKEPIHLEFGFAEHARHGAPLDLVALADSGSQLALDPAKE
jgi:hypothetical protein